MFNRLSEKLQATLKDLRGQGKISESNISATMREIRMALLEADVHFQVAKDFIAQVREKSLGEEVLLSVTPGQQIVKIFHDELTRLFGGDSEDLNLAAPGHILLVGLNGAGKTTSTAKLAVHLREQGHRPGMVACDLVRPAAIRQLGMLAEQNNLPAFLPAEGEKDVLDVVRRGKAWAAENHLDVVLFDTAGRQEVEESLIEEIKSVRAEVEPGEVLLVCDAATGQGAVSVAERFHEALGLTGFILTKLDGDARGGAALSLRQVTGQPIKFAGTGEKVGQFEVFHPDRMAGRILGMGDVVTLVERAAAAIDEEDAARMEQRLRTATFDLNDFLEQFRMMKKLGPLDSILGMIPGMANLKNANVDEGQMRRIEAIILSMTPTERSRPELLNARRRKRVASGSGVTVSEVNNLLLRFSQMKKMMKKAGGMKKMMAGMSKAGFPGLK
jgi:signal recognition particle subunit SRP54